MAFPPLSQSNGNAVTFTTTQALNPFPQARYVATTQVRTGVGCWLTSGRRRENKRTTRAVYRRQGPPKFRLDTSPMQGHRREGFRGEGRSSGQL